MATHTGILSAVSFTSFQIGYPNGGFTISIYKANALYQPIGNALSSSTIPVDAIGWSPKGVVAYPNIEVQAGTRYAIVVKSSTTSGSFGLQYNDSAPYQGGGAAYSNNGGNSFIAETDRILMFKSFIKADLPSSVKEMSNVTFNACPNSVKEYLKVSLETINVNSIISIWDIYGQQCLSKVIQSTGYQDISIDMSSYKGGLYFLNLEDGKNSKVMKIVKI